MRVCDDDLEEDSETETVVLAVRDSDEEGVREAEVERDCVADNVAVSLAL